MYEPRWRSDKLTVHGSSCAPGARSAYLLVLGVVGPAEIMRVGAGIREQRVTVLAHRGGAQRRITGWGGRAKAEWTVEIECVARAWDWSDGGRWSRNHLRTSAILSYPILSNPTVSNSQRKRIDPHRRIYIMRSQPSVRINGRDCIWLSAVPGALIYLVRRLKKCIENKKKLCSFFWYYKKLSHEYYFFLIFFLLITKIYILFREKYFKDLQCAARIKWSKI